MDKGKYWLEKLRNRKTGYPIATVAFYGPDNQFASKVVVGIFENEKQEDATEIRKWFARDQDVRKDKTINDEMHAFITSYQVRRIGMTDGILGCPHEEGIDYPEGQSCPQCPYWKNRDRWTGELIR